MAARQMQSAAQIEAASRARAEGTQQARTTQSPLVQRSAMLAELLKQGQEPPQRIAGYGDLAVRLLSQGLLSAAKSKTDKAVSAEAYNADLERRRRLAAAIPGVTVQGEPQEVGNGRLGNPLAGLANMLRGGGQPQPPPPPAAPPVPGQGQPPMAAPPPPMPTVTNTQNPVESPVAPVGPVQGQPMPPVGQPAPAAPMAPPAAPMPQAAPPQAPANPLSATPQEIALVQQYLNSPDPGEVAQGEQMVQAIQARLAAPAASRFEIHDTNGIPFRVDPAGAVPSQPVFANGLPADVMNTNATVGQDNPYGVQSGTGISLDRFNRPTIVGQPQQGYERVGGRLQIESGGSADITNPSQQFEALSKVRAEIRPILDQATALQRAHNSLLAGLSQRNGPGDVAAINGFQKLVDDGVVREGDVTTQLRAAGIEGGIAGLTAYMTSTGRLDDNIREKMRAAGEAIFSAQNRTFQERAMGYEGLVNRTFGEGTFEDVLPASTREAFGWARSAPVPADPRPQSRPASSRPAAPRQPAAPTGPAPTGQRRRYNPATGRIE